MGFIGSAVALLSCLLATSDAALQPIDEQVRKLLPTQVDPLKLSKVLPSARVDPSLIGAQGTQTVIVSLKSPPVAMMHGEKTLSERLQQKANLHAEQSAFMSRTGTSPKEITCVQTLLNAVILKIDASEVGTIASDPDVVSIHRSRNYEKRLDETVPYIGATQVQQQGFDGTGIKVAVLDSGIDYTHASLGGSGTVEGFEKAYSDPASRDGLFPTDRVVEGFDFVGETWPDGDLQPDDDPIDIDGHGTAVAAIIGGEDGVAPNVDLYAVKVCSAIAGACNDIAILQGMEYAVDPNGDGDTSDAVDIINLSLGSSYVPAYDDPLAVAADSVSALGVLVVAAGGNAGDLPFITGSPSSASSVLSVAQTQVPSASLQLLTVASSNYPAVFQTWSKQPEEAVVGPIQYGDGQGGNLDGCLSFTAGSLDGKIVLVDRGTCNFTLKISNIMLGGGIAGVIGLIAAGTPFNGGDGGDRPVDIPSYMISQADADAIRATLPEDMIIDPDNKLPLVMQMVGTSARGPQSQGSPSEGLLLFKPEIGAPGSSVAAVAGTGSETAAFGGTSGATPMVVGAAALLLQKYPFLSPPELKARLMNNAEINIDTDPIEGLAPISRIGGGELRVDRALSARCAAWDDDTLQGGLSFGFVDVTRKVHQIFRTIRIRNYSDDVIEYSFNSTFRFAEDSESGAVTVEPLFPGAVRLGAHEDRTVSLVMTIRGDLLPDNFMSSGIEGANPSSLTSNEYDGYLELDDGDQPIYMAWHVLPRKAANVTVESETLDFTGTDASVSIVNTGEGEAQIDTYSLLAVSPDLPNAVPGEEMPRPDIKAVSVKTIPVEAGVCSDSESFVWSFAVTTWERQQHLVTVTHMIYLDTDQDGNDDYAVFNEDASIIDENAVAADGRLITVSLELTGNLTLDAFFFVEHSINTANTVLNICAEQVGMTQSDLLSTTVDVRVETFSTFYMFDAGDFVEGITITPGGERYVATIGDLGTNETGVVQVQDTGGSAKNSEELGVMLITNGDRGAGKRGGATEESEAILLRA